MKIQSVFEMMVGMLITMLAAAMVLYLIAGSRGISHSVLMNGTPSTENGKVLALERLCGCYPSG